MRIVVERYGGVVTSVSVRDAADAPVESVDRFLAQVLATGGSPNTALAYGYDLRYHFEFLQDHGVDWREFSPGAGRLHQEAGPQGRRAQGRPRTRRSTP